MVSVKKFGKVSVDDGLAATHNVHVSVDGIEVTRRCREADDEKGYAECLIETTEGRLVQDPKTGEPMKEVLHGNVIIWKE